MAISKTVDGSNTTVKFEYTHDTTEVENTLSDAAKYLYLSGYTGGVTLDEGETVEDLTNGEKGTICDKYVKKVLRQAGASYYIDQARSSATSTATTECETRHIPEED